MDVRERFADLVAGLRCLPNRRGWRKVALELGWSLPLMLVVAHLGGLVRFDPAGDATTLLLLGATLFVAPALGEELLFRGLLIPRRAASAQWTLLSVLLFVLWHPLQAVTARAALGRELPRSLVPGSRRHPRRGVGEDLRSNRLALARSCASLDGRVRLEGGAGRAVLTG